MNYCEDCKFCQLNVLLNEYNRLNWFQKIKFIISKKGTELQVAHHHPKCFHPNVYKKTFQDLVFKEAENEKMYCSTAREAHIPNSIYLRCGENADFYEENTNNNK